MFFPIIVMPFYNYLLFLPSSIQDGGLHQRIDKQLVSKIEELLISGARNVKEVKRHLKIFAEKEMYRDKIAPPRCKQRFYPSKKTIPRHIYKTLVKKRFSVRDQENLEKKVKEWKRKCPDETFFFRAYVSEESDSLTEERADDKEDEDDDMEDNNDDNDEVTLPTSKNGLLFVHQTDNQRRLLLRYGDELSMLNTPYKTTKYSLALFLISGCEDKCQLSNCLIICAAERNF